MAILDHLRVEFPNISQNYRLVTDYLTQNYGGVVYGRMHSAFDIRGAWVLFTVAMCESWPTISGSSSVSANSIGSQDRGNGRWIVLYLPNCHSQSPTVTDRKTQLPNGYVSKLGDPKDVVVLAMSL